MAPETHFELGNKRMSYLEGQIHPPFSRDAVEEARLHALNDGLKVLPGNRIVVLPKTPAPIRNSDFTYTLGVFFPDSPDEVFLLPRQPDLDMRSYQDRVRADVAEYLVRMERFPAAMTVIGPRIERILLDADRSTPAGIVSRTLKHEFGHLLQHKFYPTWSGLVSEFGSIGYFSLAVRRGIIKLAQPTCDDKDILYEAIAEDFVHTMRNPYVPNVRAPLDIIDEEAAKKGSEIVAELISRKAALDEPEQGDPPATTPPTPLSDEHPLELLRKNIQRLTSGEFDDQLRTLENTLNQSR